MWTPVCSFLLLFLFPSSLHQPPPFSSLSFSSSHSALLSFFPQGPHWDSMASPTSTNPAHGHFESFLQAQFCKDVLSSFQGLCEALGLEPGGGLPQYHKIKAQLNYWSAKSLWAKLDKRAGQPVYQQGQACASTKVNIWRRGTVENEGAVRTGRSDAKPTLPCVLAVSGGRCWALRASGCCGAGTTGSPCGAG